MDEEEWRTEEKTVNRQIKSKNSEIFGRQHRVIWYKSVCYVFLRRCIESVWVFYFSAAFKLY